MSHCLSDKPYKKTKPENLPSLIPFPVPILSWGWTRGPPPSGRLPTSPGRTCSCPALRLARDGQISVDPDGGPATCQLKTPEGGSSPPPCHPAFHTDQSKNARTHTGSKAMEHCEACAWFLVEVITSGTPCARCKLPEGRRMTPGKAACQRGSFPSWPGIQARLTFITTKPEQNGQVEELGVPT